MVTVVGAGHVGTAAAYAMFLRGVPSEIRLVDLDARRAEGEAMDLMHAQAVAGPTRVRAATFAELGDAEVVVLAAGATQRPGETRLALLERNARTTDDVVRALDRHAPDAILLVATNPVDLLTDLAQRASHRPASRVFGTGTLLDSARLRALVGAHLGVDPRSVHAYVLGEHGDSEVPIWSSANIGGTPLATATVRGRSLDPETMQSIFTEVRDAAYAIIARKGHTSLAVGAMIARIVAAIVHDQKAVFPVSVRLDGPYGIRDVCLSVPCIVGAGGIEDVLPPPLSDAEHAALRASADALRARLETLRAQMASVTPVASEDTAPSPSPSGPTA